MQGSIIMSKSKEMLILEMYESFEKQNVSLSSIKWYQLIKRLKFYIKRKKNVKVALAYAYSQGYLQGKEEMLASLKAIEEKTHIVINLSTENEKVLQQNYQTSLDELDRSWRKRCEICRRTVESEKLRAIKLQQDLQNSIYSFYKVYTKLIKFVSALDVSHETVLNHLGKLHTSKEHLETIKDEVTRFTEKHTQFLEK